MPSYVQPTSRRQSPVKSADLCGPRPVLIFGAGPGVGKTVVATALCREVEGRYDQQTLYLQPAFNALADGRDTRHVESFCRAEIHSIRGYGTETPDLDRLQAARDQQRKGQPGGAYAVEDKDAAGDIIRFMDQHGPKPGKDGGWLFIEAIGGVMTPSFAGRPQAHVYRWLGFPTVLVGSSGFDGVSRTISALECLEQRHYKVVAVVMFKEEVWKNYRYVDQWLRHRRPSVRVVLLPWRPGPGASSGIVDPAAMKKYYSDVYDSCSLYPVISSLHTLYQQRPSRA